ncbi:MAG: 1-deoxy-D-xylulose-5-phosphate reductoisomerase, partial [Pseudomonadota bacterium]|nr:1-deoxy-D-xylulose-5-phosphate reductoisomerase [Pseudomonadota bacterium]
MKNLTILGSTGTIGENTLDVVAMFPDKFSVFALTANKSVEKIFKQIVRWHPKYAVLSSLSSAKLLFEKVKGHSKLNTIVLGGAESIEFVASHDETDYVMAAIVGGAGLLPSLSAARHGKRILLANKESLVMSGELFMNEVKKSGSELLPIDSEHNAIFQCLPNDYNGLQDQDKKKIRKLILTA